MTCSGLGDRPGHGCQRSAVVRICRREQTPGWRDTSSRKIERAGTPKMNFEVMASGTPGGFALSLSPPAALSTRPRRPAGKAQTRASQVPSWCSLLATCCRIASQSRLTPVLRFQRNSGTKPKTRAPADPPTRQRECARRSSLNERFDLCVQRPRMTVRPMGMVARLARPPSASHMIHARTELRCTQ